MKGMMGRRSRKGKIRGMPVVENYGDGEGHHPR